MKFVLSGIVVLLSSYLLGNTALAADTVAPAAISDLQLSASSKATQLHLLISFGAPSDSGDGSNGRAASYDVRISTSAITSQSAFLAARQVTGVSTLAGSLPIPGVAGVQQNLEVIGLTPNKTYYVAIESIDAAGNRSALSNAASRATAKYEGYGYQTIGGGDGQICRVTSLASSGTGSLRECLSTSRSCSSQPMTVVFNVGGKIELTSDISLSADDCRLTLDGSTAPSPGITIGPVPCPASSSCPVGDACLGGGEFKIGQNESSATDNIILTHLRFQGSYQQGWGECLDNSAATLGMQYFFTNIVLDHLTIRNGPDGSPDLWTGTKTSQSVTISNTLLSWNYHPLLIGSSPGTGKREDMTIHHSVIARSGQRTPKIHADSNDIDFRNNVIFDWDSEWINAGGGDGARISPELSGGVWRRPNVNLVNNYFMAGPLNGVPKSMQPRLGLFYGNNAGPDSEDGYVVPSGGNPYPPQGTVISGTNLGEVWTSGNILPSDNRDQYSTVSNERDVPTAARVTTDSASALGMTVLPVVGTHFRKSDETALMSEIAAGMGTTIPPTPTPTPNLCGNGQRESGEACDDGLSNGICPAPCSLTCSLNTTCGVPDTSAPSGVGNLSPSNGATAVSTSPTLVAKTASDETGPVSYYFELFQDSSCSGTRIQFSDYAPSTSWSPSALSDGRTYSFRNKAKDSASPIHESAFGACTSFTTSTVMVLNPPSNLRGNLDSQYPTSRIHLIWDDNSLAETGFEVWRCRGSEDCTNFELNGTTLVNTTTYMDAGQPANTYFWYKVRAIDDNRESAFTEIFTIRTASTAPTAPNAPSGLLARTISTSQIDLEWDDNSNNESGFKIERCPGICGISSSGWSSLPSVGANVRTYPNTGLSASSTYSYRVRATNSVGNSAYSSIVNGSTQTGGSAPPAPTDLVASPNSSSSIHLAWTDNSATESGFKIERCEGDDCTNFDEVATSIDEPYDDNGLLANTSYSYRVRAYNTAGDSGYTNIASAKTDPAPANQPPSISSFTVTPDHGRAPLGVLLKAVASDPEGNSLTYNWVFGDGGTANGASQVNHTYVTRGDYYATVTVSDGVSSTQSNRLKIHVDGKGAGRGKHRNDSSNSLNSSNTPCVVFEIELGTRLDDTGEFVPSSNQLMMMSGQSERFNKQNVCIAEGEGIQLSIAYTSQSYGWTLINEGGELRLLAGDPETFFIEDTAGQASTNDGGSFSVTSGGCGQASTASLACLLVAALGLVAKKRQQL